MKDQMPASWKFVKVDLFDNATIEELKEGRQKLKLSFSIKTYQGNDWLRFRSAMNSPRKCYKRFVMENWNWEHYNYVLAEYDNLRPDLKSGDLERLNISKCYQKGFAESKHTIDGMSALLMRTQDLWVCKYYIDEYAMTFRLDTNNLSPAQRKQGIIASSSISNDSGYTKKSAKDFL